MGEIFDSPIVQFFVYALAMMGAFIVIKAGVSMLPDSIPLATATKNVIAKA